MERSGTPNQSKIQCEHYSTNLFYSSTQWQSDTVNFFINANENEMIDHKLNLLGLVISVTKMVTGCVRITKVGVFVV